jgi:hypothetical protein
MVMNQILTVDDPLTGQEVTIVMTLPAGNAPREERPVLVSLGTIGHLPVTKSGLFGDAATLIREAWAAFSLRWQAEGVRAAAEGAGEEEEGLQEATTVTEVAVVETPPNPRPTPAAPRPQNLSLF